MFQKCYKCVTVPGAVAQIVSIQRTDQGVIVCLLLKPSETSPELLTFASKRKRSVTQPPPVSLQRLQLDLSEGLESPLTPSPGPVDARLSEFRAREAALAEVVSVRFPARAGTTATRDRERLESAPFDDTFVARVRGLLPQNLAGKAAGEGIAGLSRTVARILGLPLPTVSETMAALRGASTQEIHFELAAPGLGVPFIGTALQGALRQDLLKVLERRDLSALRGIRDILDATPQLTQGGKQKRDSLDRLAKQFQERLEPD